MSIEVIKLRHETDDAVIRNQKKKIPPKEWRSIAVDAHCDRGDLIRMVEGLQARAEELRQGVIREGCRAAKLQAQVDAVRRIASHPPVDKAILAAIKGERP